MSLTTAYQIYTHNTHTASSSSPNTVHYYSQNRVKTKLEPISGMKLQEILMRFFLSAFQCERESNGKIENVSQNVTFVGVASVFYP